MQLKLVAVAAGHLLLARTFCGEELSLSARPALSLVSVLHVGISRRTGFFCWYSPVLRPTLSLPMSDERPFVPQCTVYDARVLARARLFTGLVDSVSIPYIVTS